MDERISKLRTFKEAETMARNAERNGRPDIAEQAAARGLELKAAEKAARQTDRPERQVVKRLKPAAKLRATGEALFINGVFEGVLNDILEAQGVNPGLVCYLQPYKPALIKRLQEDPPSPDLPWKLFMSLTHALGEIRFEADIVEWHDKSMLLSEKIETLNKHFEQYQPRERGVHFEGEGGEYGRNLLGIVNLQRLEPALSVSGFIKISDDLPLRDRTRAGGWSYVIAPERREPFEVVGEENFRDAEMKELKKALGRSAQERKARLEAADPMPEQVFVRVKAFRRNQDVVAEVLSRADGHCEGCQKAAPFLRVNGTPFLEVHHVVMLAHGGMDTVENAIGLCPNCHRKRHYGQVDQLDPA